MVTPTATEDKPSIAVLPFANLSGDPKQQYFSDGITEDIITELSRFRSVIVMARNSSFAFRGKSLEMGEIGRKLGVHYLVQGSVRRQGDRIQIGDILPRLIVGVVSGPSTTIATSPQSLPSRTKSLKVLCPHSLGGWKLPRWSVLGKGRPRIYSPMTAYCVPRP